MTAHEDLEKVFRSAWTELLHAEVLEDKKVDMGELIDEASPFAGGFSFSKVLSQVEDTPNDDPVSGPDGADCNGDSGVGFTDAGWPDQQDALMRGHETSGGKFNELRARYLGIERKIEVREFLDLDNTRLFEAACEESVGTAGKLVRNEELEKLGRIQGCAACLLEAPGQSLRNARKAKVPELGRQLRVHSRFSRR